MKKELVTLVVVISVFSICTAMVISEKASFVNPPFYLNSQDLKTTGITLELKNNGGETYNIQEVSVTGCGKIDTVGPVASGSKIQVIIPCTLTLGDTFKGDITITYRKTGSSIDLTSAGSMIEPVVSEGSEVLEKEIINTAKINPPFYLYAYNVTKDGISLQLKNNGGETYEIRSIAVGPSCSTVVYKQTTNIPSGNLSTFDILCYLTTGSAYKGSIIITYRKAGSSVDLISTGIVSSLVGEGVEDEVSGLVECNISKSVINPPFYIDSYKIEPTGVTLELKNNGGETYNIQNVKVNGCGNNDSVGSLASGNKALVVIQCPLTSGAILGGDIIVTYRKTGSSVDLTSAGSICSNVEELSEGQDNQEENNEENEGEDNQCNGCLLKGKCVPFGYRAEGKYCDISNELKNQKQKQEYCENDFECQSNICLDDVCINKGFFKKIIDFFKNLFGGD